MPEAEEKYYKHFFTDSVNSQLIQDVTNKKMVDSTGFEPVTSRM